MYHEGWRAECGWPGPNYKTGKDRGHKVGDPIHTKDIDELDKLWELYDLRNDPTQRHDLAQEHPDKLKKMIDLWYSEAKTYNVLPFQGTVGQRVQLPADAGAGHRQARLLPRCPVAALVAPNTYNRPHTITAEVHVPKGGAQGVIYAMGANAGGYTLFVKDGKLNFAYNYEGHKMYRIVSDKGLPEGDVTIQYGFKVTGDTDFPNGSGAPGTGILAVNGEKIGEVDMDKTTPFIFSHRRTQHRIRLRRHRRPRQLPRLLPLHRHRREGHLRRLRRRHPRRRSRGTETVGPAVTARGRRGPDQLRTPGGDSGHSPSHLQDPRCSCTAGALDLRRTAMPESAR